LSEIQASFCLAGRRAAQGAFQSTIRAAERTATTI
jgi:hypothetical protein